MFARRALLAVIFGAGITATLMVSVGITWLLGILFLTPGIWIASSVPNQWHAPLVMFVVNTLFYSLPSYLLAIALIRIGRPSSRVLAVSICGTIAIVLVSWAATREFERRGGGVCGNEEVSSRVSPGGAHKVIIFVRDCGAVGGSSTELLLVDHNRQLNHLDTGNLLITDEVDKVSAEWKSPTSLLVSYPRNARVMQNTSQVAGVSIEYELR